MPPTFFVRKNLEETKLDGKEYTPVAVVEMTTSDNFKIENLKDSQKEMLETLKKEAKTNKFKILLNNSYIV